MNITIHQEDRPEETGRPKSDSTPEQPHVDTDVDATMQSTLDHIYELTDQTHGDESGNNDA